MKASLVLPIQPRRASSSLPRRLADVRMSPKEKVAQRANSRLNRRSSEEQVSPGIVLVYGLHLRLREKGVYFSLASSRVFRPI